MVGFLNLTKEKQENKVYEVEVGRISTNQLRTDFKQTEIVQLAESIASHGILQPLSVRRMGENFELIAGERRLKAAKLCELHTVPCIIYEMDDRNSAILALVENIQRQNLSFFDEAAAIEKLISDYGLTQEEAAAKLGKAQSTVANKLRILRLTKAEREIISKYNLTERHARALLRIGSADDRMVILEKIGKYKLNVERTEALIDDFIGNRKEQQRYKKSSQVSQNITFIINTINKAVQTMQSAGIAVESRKIQGDEYVEYRIRIPMKIM